MRGQKNSRRQAWRDQKRAMLRVMLFAVVPMIAIPALADSPASGMQFLLPPLPLEGSANAVSSGTKLNPFCQPVPDRPSSVPMTVSPIKLASGDGGSANGDWVTHGTTVRLLPSPVQPEAALRTERTATAPSPSVPTIVRSNPLAGLSVVKEPIAPHVESKHDAQPSNGFESKTLNGEGPAKPIATVGFPKLGGPVSFSLDDERLYETTTQPSSSLASVMRGNRSNNKNADKVSSSHAVKSMPVQPVATPQGYAPVKVADPRSNPTSSIRELDRTASITRGSSTSRTLLVPLSTSGDSDPVTAGRESDARIVKGARPRVEVGVLPIQIERETHAGPIVSSPITEMIQEPKGKPDESDTIFESPALVTLDMKRTEVRALKIDGEIRKVQVRDSSICAALAAGPSQLQLIGARDGVTRLAVWTAASGGEEQKSVYQVRVGEVVANDSNDAAQIANTLTKTARTAFPNSNVLVRSEKGKLVVEGTCNDQESAKQVLRMIRSACLLPVIDKLSIR